MNNKVISQTIYICPECLSNNVCKIRTELYECGDCKGLFAPKEMIVTRRVIRQYKGHVMPGGINYWKKRKR